MFDKSVVRQPDTMYLNHYEGHLSYNKHASAFQCRNCGNFFKSWIICRHEQKCDQATNLKFRGGFNNPPKSLHENLIFFRLIDAREPRKFYKFVTAYDLESILRKVQIKSSTGKLVWTEQHQAISVSLCSNVPDFETPICFVDPNLDYLLEKMFEHLKCIQQRASDEMQNTVPLLITSIQRSRNWNPRCRHQANSLRKEPGQNRSLYLIMVMLRLMMISLMIPMIMKKRTMMLVLMDLPMKLMKMSQSLKKCLRL
ncbi:unnamed protein product [Owenia fusiformis]|uniref:Uncharacterized protein n=1 Tax=Owenia fusiformis TaxID=6347 RepID=A0A8S4QF76_OWEFU|nr:unnamed protein product [Owenia fusiformis]